MFAGGCAACVAGGRCRCRWWAATDDVAPVGCMRVALQVREGRRYERAARQRDSVVLADALRRNGPHS